MWYVLCCLLTCCVCVCAVGGRQHPKPLKLKRLAKLKDVEVVSSACGSHATALITQDGKLYMFGTFEDDITDKSTGVCVPCTFTCALHIEHYCAVCISIIIMNLLLPVTVETGYTIK